jgi:hypothetical protein
MVTAMSKMFMADYFRAQSVVGIMVNETGFRS